MGTDLKRLSVVIDSKFISGHESWSLELLRERWLEAENLEVAISYVRRLAKGRIDVLSAHTGEASKEAMKDSLVHVKEATAGSLCGPTLRIAYNGVTSDSLITTSAEISELVRVDIEIAVDARKGVQSRLGGLRRAGVNCLDIAGIAFDYRHSEAPSGVPVPERADQCGPD